MGISILLPTLCCEIYALAIHHTTLFQTMFLFAGHFSDLTMGKTLSDVNLRLRVVFPKIQAVLVSGEFDEGHIISVFLLSALFHLGGNTNAAVVHLQGLSRMLARNRQQRLGNGEGASQNRSSLSSSASAFAFPINFPVFDINQLRFNLLSGQTNGIQPGRVW